MPLRQIFVRRLSQKWSACQASRHHYTSRSPDAIYSWWQIVNIRSSISDTILLLFQALATSFRFFVALFAANHGGGDPCLNPGAGRDAAVSQSDLSSWMPRDRFVCETLVFCLFLLPSPVLVDSVAHCEAEEPCFVSPALLEPASAQGEGSRTLKHTHTHLWLILQRQLLTYLPIIYIFVAR